MTVVRLLSVRLSLEKDAASADQWWHASVAGTVPRRPRSPLSGQRGGGFTLVEVLVAMSVILLLLFVLLTMTNQISTIWRSTSGRGEQFRASREAFESMTRRLSAATLNTYWDYVDSGGNARTSTNSSTFIPQGYARQSELRFVTGPMSTLANGTSPPAGADWITHGAFFQAARGVSEPGVPSLDGLDSMLNTWGYFVEFGSDATIRPPIPGISDGNKVPLKYRFRLYELLQPANQMTVYGFTSGNPAYKERDWFTVPLGSTTNRPIHVLAENVVALVLLPKLASKDAAANGYTDASLAPGYLYDSTVPNQDKNLDSKNQLPPVVQLTIVAVDESSYSRFQAGQTQAPAGLGLSTLFRSVGDTTNPTNPGYAQDLSTLEQMLVSSRIDYRVFTTSVRIKGAKWSQEQSN